MAAPILPEKLCFVHTLFVNTNLHDWNGCVWVGVIVQVNAFESVTLGENYVRCVI